MTISSSMNNGILTVKPVGRLDSSTSEEFGSYLEENVTDEVKELKFDFGGVDFISSKGLRILVLVYKKLNGRRMEITGANDAVREVLRLSDFLTLFNVN